MKKSKRLLLVLTSALLLAGCNNKPADTVCPACPECIQQITDDTVKKPFMEEAEAALKEKFDEIYENTEINAHVIIKELYEEALKELNNKKGFDSEEEAQECAEILIEEFCNPTLVEITIRHYSDLILDVISRTRVNETSILLEIKDFKFWELRNISEQEGFFAALGIVNEIQQDVNRFWEIYPQFVPVVPEDPEDPSYIYLRYKQEVTDFGYYLAAISYPIIDSDEIISSRYMNVEVFDNVNTEDEARALTKNIKDEFYAYVFNLYKQRLCGALNNYVQEVLQTIKAESISLDINDYLTEDKEEIMKQPSFEDAFYFYESCYDVLDSDVGSALSSHYTKVLSNMHTQLIGMCDGDSSLIDQIYDEWNKAYQEIVNNTSDIRDKTSEMEKVIDDFEIFCLTLLGLPL